MKPSLIRLGWALTSAVSLSACATVVQPVDQARLVSINYSLDPITPSHNMRTIQQGDIAFEWEASATARHAVTVKGETAPLALGRTDRGNVYCTDMKQWNQCFEDRDADGQIDHVWKPVRGDDTLPFILGVGQPEQMVTPVRLDTLDTEVPLLSGKVGLLYNGPLRGLVGEGGMFDMMIGSMAMGWHHGADSPRDALGSGWSHTNVVFFLTGEEVDENETIYDSLGLSIQAEAANVDGSVDLRIEAQPITDVDLREELEFDMDRVPEFDGDVSPT